MNWQVEQQPKAQSAQTMPGIGASLGQPQQPSEEGIASAVRRLCQEIQENSVLAENLRTSLGISSPKNGATSPGDSSLMYVLRSATQMLASTNGDLTDILKHLNS